MARSQVGLVFLAIITLCACEPFITIVSPADDEHILPTNSNFEALQEFTLTVFADELPPIEDESVILVVHLDPIYGTVFAVNKEFVVRNPGQSFELALPLEISLGLHIVSVRVRYLNYETICETKIRIFVGNHPRNDMFTRAFLTHSPFQTHSRAPTLKMLIWNAPLYLEHWWLQEQHHDCFLPWDYSYNRLMLPVADVVMLWLDDLWDIPPYKPAGQLWVGFRTESYVTFEAPQLVFDVRSQLDIYSSYELHSDLPITLFKPFYLQSSFSQLYNIYSLVVTNMTKTVKKEYTREAGATVVETTTSSRVTIFRDQLPRAVWIASNCVTPNNRIEYVAELMKHFPVDSFGKCLNTRGKSTFDPVQKLNVGERQDSVGKYMFVLAFENADVEDYISERPFQAMQMGAIPVYMGAHNIREFVPHPDSIIFTNDFSSAESLAAYLHSVVASPELLHKHHAWRHLPPPRTFLNKVALSIETFTARLCHKAVAHKFERADKTWSQNFAQSLNVTDAVKPRAQ